MPNYLICLTSNKSEFFCNKGWQLISCLAYVDYTNIHISLNPGWAALPISTHRTSVFRSLKGQKEQSTWGHLILSQAEIESSTKPGFTESMNLKGFSPLLLLCWSAIIIANHNVNNFEQMSMLKAKCDFDGGDCCPNENNRLWNTYCNDCQCLDPNPTTCSFDSMDRGPCSKFQMIYVLSFYPTKSNSKSILILI